VDQQDTPAPGRPIAATSLGELHANGRVDEEAVRRRSGVAVARPRADVGAATSGAVRSTPAAGERRRWLGQVSKLSSRARMARRLLAAADAERERIEHDIHDGVQAHLTALRIQLALAADRFEARGDAQAATVLNGFGDDVERIIDEVRDLARGIYPTLLTTQGLSAALAAAGLHAAGPVTVRAGGVRRCRPDVEIAVYFTCLAALDNAAKHAGPAEVDVSLSDSGSALHFAVRDSGSGFDPAQTPNGTGIANMRDRIAAVGGTLAVDSTPGHGTRVRGSVPARWLHTAST
jgi:signal transduction histidine kinase